MEKIYRLLAEGRGGHERAPLEKFQLHFSLLRQHDATRDPFNFDIIFLFLAFTLNLAVASNTLEICFKFGIICLFLDFMLNLALANTKVFRVQIFDLIRFEYTGQIQMIYKGLILRPSTNTNILSEKLFK